MQTDLPEPDLSLLRDIQRADGGKLGPVHLQHFHKDNKDLYYIGTHHGTNIENVSHETIGQAIYKYKPQCVVLEGIETVKGVSPQLGIDPKLPPHVQAARYFQSEENVHTAELLRKKNVPFIGGEPPTSAVFKSVEQQGYSTKEVMGLYLLRMIPQWRRRGVLKDSHQFTEMATNFLKSPVFSHVPDQEKLTLQEFNAWYDQHKAELGNKEYLQTIAADSNSNNAPDANYFQKMANSMDAARDSNIIATVNEVLKQYDKVLVVYGNAHQYTSEPIFEKMFESKGTIETLVLTEHKPRQTSQPANQQNPNNAYQTIAGVAGISGIASGAMILNTPEIAQRSLAKTTAVGAIVAGSITAMWSMLNLFSTKNAAPSQNTAKQNNSPDSAENASGNGHVARLQQEQSTTSPQR